MRRAILISAIVIALLTIGVTRGQDRGFINVEGATLQSRLEAALRQGNARSGAARFLVAYSFDVRPGVGVDVEIPGISGTSGIVTGVDARYETRNVALFMLFEAGSASPIEVELRNLERRKDYEGRTVYWLGRASSEESLTLLQRLVETSRNSQAAEDLTQAIALHDAPQTTPLLQSIVRRSSFEDVKTMAVRWLGRAGGQTAFLSEVARNERETSEVREQAVMSIGKSLDAGAVATLERLYAVVANRQLKERIIDAALKNRDRETAIKFLTRIVEKEQDAQLREHALNRLRKKAGQKDKG
jgi:hypothetical protein